jgi:hypothetical protein
MTLLEIAEKFNKQHDAAIKAEQERVRKAEVSARRHAYYQDHAAHWFQEVLIELESLIHEFNSVTGDHSKLSRVEGQGQQNDCIEVAFLRDGLSIGETSPRIVLSRERTEMKLLLEIRNVKKPARLIYEVLVKMMSRFEVRAITVTEKTQLGEGVQWRDRVTGEMNYEPTFFTKSTTNRTDLGTKDFADHVLSTFTQKILESAA